jgi:hypothetical protein
MSRGALLLRPRPAPGRVLPLAAAAGVIALALPVFVIAGWRIQGWALGAVLWAGSQALGLLLARMRTGMNHLAASGVVAFGMMFRAIAVMIVLIAVAVSEPRLALAAALLYALAYTLELAVALTTYFGGTPR